MRRLGLAVVFALGFALAPFAADARLVGALVSNDMQTGVNADAQNRQVAQ
jgi:hypothetical protein